MKCIACKEKIEVLEIENGDALKEVSPISFRIGWIHNLCYQELLEEAKLMQSSRPNLYQSRYDEYLTKYR